MSRRRLSGEFKRDAAPLRSNQFPLPGGRGQGEGELKPNIEIKIKGKL